MKLKPKNMILLGIILVGITFVGVVAFKQAAQVQEDVQIIQRYRQVTDKEKSFSRALTKRTSHGEKKLTELMGTGDRDIIIPRAENPSNIGQPILTFEQEFEKQICESDAVILGQSLNRSIHLSEDDKIVYSEYGISTQRVFKNNLRSPIQINTVVQVARPGGNIRVDGRLIRYVNKEFAPLQKNKNYLLFLKYVPETNNYTSFIFGKDYLVEVEHSIRAVIPEDPKGTSPIINTNSLITLVNGAVTSARCNQN